MVCQLFFHYSVRAEESPGFVLVLRRLPAESTCSYRDMRRRPYVTIAIPPCFSRKSLNRGVSSPSSRDRIIFRRLTFRMSATPCAVSISSFLSTGDHFPTAPSQVCLHLPVAHCICSGVDRFQSLNHTESCIHEFTFWPGESARWRHESAFCDLRYCRTSPRWLDVRLTG